ncbi:MAG: 1-deoxy-D-xylulose-5-phosphate synthase [Clostridia bacterium]|nr:1-deoxy-D-xylulose-5-phosphate synthase [Clostridia bacterium]
MEIKLLNTITNPADVKALSEEDLIRLAAEVRETLVHTTAQTGGHLASNLGAVELTIALHKVFESPKDSLIWDVGHQVYTHKLLTGRYEAFSTLRQNGGLSGFPNPEESAHDVFAAGHSGTSVAAGYGLSVGKNLHGDRSHTVAVIGDGSFTGGLVYEALNNAGHSKTHFIVVLNDNEMSISPNVGSLAGYLTRIRTNPAYYELKDDVRDFLHRVPVVGDKSVDLIIRTKKELKDRLYGSNMFEDLGFTYMGPVDGHDIHELCNALEAAKLVEEPVLLHIRTVKGKGYLPAERNPSKFHGVSPFNEKTGETKPSTGTNFSKEFGKYLCKFAEEDPNVCAITAAMGLGTGLEDFALQFPDRYFDVGIAEEFAVTFAGGLAKGGMIPVFAVYSTFLQRAYDEMVHDVAMQNQKVVLAVDRAGFVGSDGRSHQGIFDLAYLRTIPGTVVYSPATYKGMGFFLYRALYEDGNIVAVRYPRGQQGYLPEGYEPNYDDFNILGNEKADTMVVSFGAEFSEAARAVDELAGEGIAAGLIKLNKVWPINPAAVEAVCHAKHVLFFEEGARSGGIGEAFGLDLLEHGFTGQYHLTAVGNTFVHHASIPELRREFRLDAESIKGAIRALYEQ